VFFASAQNSSKIYDLINELRNSKQDTSKADIFVQLANEYYPLEVEKAISKAELALMMMEPKKDTRRVFSALDILIRCHLDVKTNLDVAAKYLTKVRSLDTTHLSNIDNSKLYELEGKMFFSLSDHPKAQKAFLKQLSLLEQNIGKVPPKDLASVYFNLGELYAYQNDNPNATNHYLKSLSFYQNSDNLEGRVKVLNALGKIYAKVNLFDQSLQYSNDALFLCETIYDKTLTAYAYINSGIALNRLARQEEAITHLYKAIELGSTINNSAVVCKGKLALGDIYDKSPQDTATLRLYREALDAALATNDKALIRDVYEKLYVFYDGKDDTGFAHLYLKNLVSMRDSLNVEEQSKQFIVNKIRFEAEKKEQENRSLLAKQLESQVTIQRQKLGNIILLILMLGLAFGGYFLYKSLKQKKKYNVELEGEVEKRTKQLQVSNEELLKTNQNLEQSNNELERFAYIASHDLKSPLRNIISFLNLIQRKLKAHNDTDLQEYLRFATENAKQMHSLIQDVLEFSKVEAEPSGKKDKIDMNESMMLVVQNLNESIKETNAEIITETLPIVEANSVHLLQLLQNLVGNGIKYNKNHNPKVEVKYNLVNGFHLFTIKDNGIGIDKQYHDQIFEMFKRLHTRDEYKGTGIGLAICKKIVTSLGGRLWLDSDYGKGSTFYFTVPV
jgi:signal transduction histidine kinase